ncbi:hypothetical protein [Halobellus salinisoli]|uniref:hypothetical protein n=1 Tax=Halobellus salinisoli TaxID=3108500 RepID=UPI00300BF975
MTVDEISSGIPKSHKTMLDEFEWSNEVGRVDMAGNVVYFDSFLISGLGSRSSHFRAVQDFRKRGEHKLESKLCDEFPLIHIGTFPHNVSLYYVLSSVDELINDNHLKVDFPMFGGYVAYERDLGENAVESLSDDVRNRFEELLNKTLEYPVKVHWGSLPNVEQSPNMFYFATDDGFLTGSDVYPNQQAPHSIFFNYNDIINTPISERKPKRLLHFASPETGGSGPTTTPTVEEVSLKFNPATGDLIDSSIEIPLLELDLEIRDYLQIRVGTEVSS